MKQVLLFFSLIVILSVSSCKVDKCKDVNCQNGGICNEGKCFCASGFKGTNCQTQINPCDTITCLNGGVCVTGNCNCPTRFTGIHCEVYTNPCDTTPCFNGGICVSGNCNCAPHFSGDSCTVQEIPSKMYITGVVINHFCPVNPNAISWDEYASIPETITPADIYPVIKRNGTVIYNGYTQNPNYAYKHNANYDTQYSMPFYQDSISITDVTNQDYRIELWDYDDGINDDFMYGFTFTPYTGTNGFPSSLFLQGVGVYAEQFEFRINFSPYYEW
ncbi:MAG: hypothetical protein V4615_16740 [Bacteroidota bacterium]